MSEQLGSFMRKWGQAPPSSPEQTAIMELDQQRVARGKFPLSQEQTFAAVSAATNREQFTPTPESNMWNVPSNAVSDITSLVRGIPQLPMGILNLGKNIMQDPFGRPEGGNIADANILQALPGAFIASAILPGGVPAGDLARRPVSAALDALPFASSGVNRAALNTVRGFHPGAQLRSHGTAQQLRARMQPGRIEGNELFNPDIPLPELNRQQRRAMQAVIASGEGGRVLPNLATRRILPGPQGRYLEADQRWLARAKENPAVRGFVTKLSPTTRQAFSVMRGAEARKALEAQSEPVQQAAKDWSVRFHDTYTDPKLAESKLEKLQRAISDPDSFGMVTPQEAMTVLRATDPDLQPWFDDAIKLSDDITENSLAGENPVVARYDRDGGVYTAEEHKRLLKGDARLSRAQDELAAKQKNIDKPEKKLVAAMGADAFEAVRRGDEDLARRLMTQRGIKQQTTKINAVHKVEQLNEQLEYLINGDLDDYILDGPLDASRFSYGALDGFMTKTEWEGLARTMKAANRQVKLRLAQRVRTRPATQIPTAQRYIWENFQKNQKIASEQMPAKYGADQWDMYRHEYKQIQKYKDPKLRFQGTQRMKAELGNDYRYLHYIVPGDPDWMGYAEDMMRQNMWQQLEQPAARGELQRLIDQAKQSLADMERSQQGYEPVYIPRVPIEATGQLDNTTVRAAYSTPDHGKQRTYDYAPMHPDLGVSFAYNAMQDHMYKVGVPYMIDQFEKLDGVISERELNDLLRAEFDSYKSMGTRPDMDNLQKYVESAKKGATKRFVPFDPSQFFPHASPTRTGLDALWMPAEFEDIVRNAVSDAFDFSKFLDPITGLFRTSVLLMSPAWHWNNVLGNMLITAVTNPKAFGKLGQKWQDQGGWSGVRRYVAETDAKDSGLDRAISGEVLNDGTTFTPREIQAGIPGILGAIEQITIRTHKRAGKEFIENGLARSRTGLTLWDQMTHSPAWEKMVGGIEKASSASLGFNSFFDDLARRANFEQFADDAMDSLVADHKRMNFGKAPDKDTLARLENEATTRALRQTQDWLMDWSQMLPIERSFLRAIFPFYSFTSHIMRAAFKFPFDHPLRVATINAITRAQEEDWQSRYPPIFRTLLGMPNPDDDREWTGLNVNSFNPFRDVGSMLTLGGILGATNPVLQTMFEQLGIDVMRGGPEYSPNFVYDETDLGGQALDAGNPVVNLAKNLVPQADTITKLMGLDASYRELQRTDPATANRMLLTGLRLPVPFRTIDVDKAVAKDELKRFNDLRGSLKDLDANNVGRYVPEISGAVEQAASQRELANATAGQLAQMVVDRQAGPPYIPLTNFVTM